MAYTDRVPLAQSSSCICLSLSPVLEMAKTMVTLPSGLMAMHRWASVFFGRAKMNSVDGHLRFGP
ncbi:hypothetical protein NC652_007897 [Populus alba x Populus x berolinensis]|nr:hypothetical protein NC652_007897 [Populus alba x Populus x berolinensis]